MPFEKINLSQIESFIYEKKPVLDITNVSSVLNIDIENQD